MTRLATRSRAVSARLPSIATDPVSTLAQTFSAFYRDCKVLNGPSPEFRLGLVGATRAVVARSLDLLGIEAPERM